MSLAHLQIWQHWSDFDTATISRDMIGDPLWMGVSSSFCCNSHLVYLFMEALLPFT